MSFDYNVLICEPCGGTEFAPTPHTDVMGYGVDLVRCVACGVKRYTGHAILPGTGGRRIMNNEINDSPASHVLAEKVRRTGALIADDPAKLEQQRASHRAYYTQMIDRLRIFAKGNDNPGALDSVYEVGANLGEFLMIACDLGATILGGCDPNRRACEIGREDWDLDIEYAFFQAATGITARAWDAVIMLDVIEHTETPRADLEKALEHLRPGGMLLLKTFYDDWHETFVGLDTRSPDWNGPHGYFGPPGHLWHFDEAVLLRLIERVGFSICVTEKEPKHGQVQVYACKP